MDLNEMLDVVQISEFEGLFTNERIVHDEITNLGLYVYDFRHDDEGNLCTVEDSVMVNHGGSFITAEKVNIPECGYINIADEINFTGDTASINDLL